MKPLFLLTAALLCLTACKTRKVDTSQTSVTEHVAISHAVMSNTIQIDSTLTNTRIKSIADANQSFEIDIIPDTGKLQIINGNYIGKARNIVIKGNAASKQVIDELIQQNKAQITQSSFTDNATIREDVKQDIKTKNTASKAGFGWIFWAIAGILILITALYFTKRIF